MISKKPQLVTNLVFVTPDMAKMWLQRNIDNRNIKKHKVLKFRHDLRNGTFHTTHQGIAFQKGELKDGQHRLTAIAEEGIGAWMMVTDGLQSSDLMSIDRGTIRSISDNAKLSGVSVSTRNISIAYVAMEAPKGIAHTSSTTENEVLDFIDAHHEAYSQLPQSSRRHLTKAGPMAAFLRSYYYCPKPAWSRCLHLYMDGTDDEFDALKERSIIVFRDYALGNSVNGYANTIDMYKRAQRAIKGFMNAESLKLIKPCSEDLFPLNRLDVSE